MGFSWINNLDVCGHVVTPKSLQTVTCSLEIRRQLLLDQKAKTNLDSVLKNGDTALLTKVHTLKAMAFPAVTYSYDSWTVKKAECQRTDAFEPWCWKRLLKIPWRSRRSNQTILREINPECSLEGLKLKLKFQYFSHLIGRANSLEKTLIHVGF